jgi:hypothetical protein
MFIRKDQVSLMEHLAHGVPHIRQGCKHSAGTNTLAYLSKAAVTRNKRL